MPTLSQFLSDDPAPSGGVEALILDVARACTAISQRIASGALAGVLGAAGATNVQGEQQQKLDVLANELFLRTTERNGLLAGMASEELEAPYQIPSDCARGRFLLVFDPLDGSSNIDVNVSVGSIFSILRAPVTGPDVQVDDFLQAGTEQVAAGYAIYGPSTILMLTVGSGVHAFTLDPGLGEFVLTRRDIKVPEATAEFAINTSNRRFWAPPVQRYIDECLAGTTGPREKDFNMRWVASLVAEAHRILTRGGVFLYPRDSKDPQQEGRLRLLYEANPIAFLIEQAGGRASTGRGRVLEVRPQHLHQRIGFVFGARDEVDRIERYHRDPEDQTNPLYGTRGLYRASA